MQEGKIEQEQVETNPGQEPLAPAKESKLGYLISTVGEMALFSGFVGLATVAIIFLINAVGGFWIATGCLIGGGLAFRSLGSYLNSRALKQPFSFLGSLTQPAGAMA